MYMYCFHLLLGVMIRISACFIVFIVSVLFITEASAQGMGSGSMIESEKLLQSGSSQLKNSFDTKDAQVVFDNVVDSRYYRVGPGDVLSYQKLDALALEELITITPECSVFLPRIGLVDVKGKTLQETKDTLLLLQKQRTPNVPCYVSLKKARTILVTVRGNVIFPGTMAVSAAWRVSTVVKSSMQPKGSNVSDNSIVLTSKIFGQNGMSLDQNYLRQTSSILPSYCMRTINVMHNDGSSDLCDLEKSMAYNDPTYDPYLREGDEVYIPMNVPGLPSVSIGGSVARPTTIVYKQNDKASMLLKMAGRLTNLAGEVKVFLVRGGAKKELQINEQLALTGEDIPLQPGDVIVAESQATQQTSSSAGSVRIIGEVKVPGVYPIENNSTHITDVISNCGNFTDEAYLPLAYILRKDVNEISRNLLVDEQVERMKKLQFSNLVLEDTTRFMIDQHARRPIVSCDFTNAFKNSSSADNVVLHDGDVVIVPKNPKTVYVYGQVKKGGYIEFVKGQSIEYYINLAGGITDNADKGRERIIKGRTGVWLKNEETTIEAGDMIYVPHPPDEPAAMQVSRYSAYGSIAGGIVSLLTSLFTLYSILKP